eukprot:TRINITY_DN1429_c0_g1_i1.p1 TRINITY_DN1429_c0_g1~~TRINITY_DN1429_c0_g1_i1.p1  ORF type:complete len:356 (-),score=60.56 TRINITY_DN1429_c0_g1_i1:242-1222(-)
MLKRKLPTMWTPDEDERLRQAVQKRAANDRRNWKEIALAVPGRTGDQCCQRWTRVLSPHISREKWQPEEDTALCKRVIEIGECSWRDVAQGMPGRTDIQCRYRWFQLKKAGMAPLEEVAASQPRRRPRPQSSTDDDDDDDMSEKEVSAPKPKASTPASKRRRTLSPESEEWDAASFSADASVSLSKASLTSHQSWLPTPSDCLPSAPVQPAPVVLSLFPSSMAPPAPPACSPASTAPAPAHPDPLEKWFKVKQESEGENVIDMENPCTRNPALIPFVSLAPASPTLFAEIATCTTGSGIDSDYGLWGFDGSAFESPVFSDLIFPDL